MYVWMLFLRRLKISKARPRQALLEKKAEKKCASRQTYLITFIDFCSFIFSTSARSTAIFGSGAAASHMDFIFASHHLRMRRIYKRSSLLPRKPWSWLEGIMLVGLFGWGLLVSVEGMLFYVINYISIIFFKWIQIPELPPPKTKTLLWSMIPVCSLLSDPHSASVRLGRVHPRCWTILQW